MIDWTTIEDALFDFVSAHAATAFGSAVPFVWSHYGEPIKVYPSGSLQWIGDPKRFGSDGVSKTFPAAEPAGAEVVLTYDGPREASLSIAIRGGGDEGFDLGREALERVADSIGKIATLLFFSKYGTPPAESGVVLLSASGPRSIPELVDGGWLPRAVLDLRVRFPSTSSEATGYIQTVSVTSDDEPFGG